MSGITRRRFLGKSLAGAGTLITLPHWSIAAEARKQTAQNLGSRCVSDRVELGKTGIKVSRLAMGTGMRGGNRESDQTRLGQEKFTELMRRAFDNGLNFFDMADLYGSHPFMRKALKGIPRDKCVYLSKIWLRNSPPINPSGGAKEEVERFQKELGTDFIDICLLHCLTTPDWPKTYERVLDELSELKEKGVVRAVGCSCHRREALETAVEHPWTDVVLARINHKGNKMDGPPEEIAKILKKARADGKSILGMKIYGEGTLVQPDEKDASLNYVLDNDLVDAMTIGTCSIEELDDNITRINKALKA